MLNRLGAVSRVLGKMGTPIRASAPGGSTSSSDPNWANVALLALNDNGADGSTTFTDQSNSAVSLTSQGSCAWTNVGPPTGLTTSASMDGSAKDILTGSAFTIGTGDFTFEAFVNPADGTAGTIWGNRTGPGADAVMRLALNATKFDLHSDNTVIVTGTSTPTNGAWVHVAVCRSGTSLRLFVGGTQEGGTATNSFNFNNAQAYYIGRDGVRDNVARWKGKIASARLTYAARYTSNFTPPALPLPTATT